MIGRTLGAVLVAALASSSRAFLSVNIPGDAHYPKGHCTATGCDLRGAWESAMNDSGSHILAFELKSTTLKGPLVGRRGQKVALTASSNGLQDLPVISLDGSLNLHHSQFIRWEDFDDSSYIYLSNLNIMGFHLSEPGGPPVEEYGGAIDLGATPQQYGDPDPPCHKLTGEALAQPNIIFQTVNFTKNSFHTSSPYIDDAYGAAVALRCSRCYAAFSQVNFVKNDLVIGGPARGILFINIAKYTNDRVEFIENKLQPHQSSPTYLCPHTVERDDE